MADPLDLERLLRDLSRAIVRVQRYAVDLRQDPASQADLDPYEATRWVSTRSTLEAVARQGDAGAPYLSAWVYLLLLARVSREAIVDEELARAAEVVQITAPAPAEISPREAIARLLAERAAPLRAELAAAIVRAGGEPGARAREVWSRHGELARRLGLRAPDAPLSLLPDDVDPRVLARSLLEVTDDHARESLAGARSWQEALAIGASQEAEAPWPRALSTQSFGDLFRGEAGWLDVPDLELGHGSRLVSGSSFTRGFARFGARWADAARSRELPRALAQHPMGLERRVLGGLVAGLLAEPLFLGRVLGFSALEIERTRRAQTRVAVVAARLSAARVLLRDAAFAGNRRELVERAEEHVGRALRVHVPADLTLVVPRLRLDDTARFLAFGESARLAAELRDRFDEDWFRNPEAVRHLRHLLGRAPTLRMEKTRPENGLVALAARFRDGLGAALRG